MKPATSSSPIAPLKTITLLAAQVAVTITGDTLAEFKAKANFEPLGRKSNIPKGTGGGVGGRTTAQNQERHLRTRYGISGEQYLEMLNRQKGGCAICGIGAQMKRLAVDHCHTTGKVRGLLCFNCNHGLGFIERSEWRVSAEEYLRGENNR